MKTISIVAVLLLIASFNPVTVQASDWENYEIINQLLTLPGPGAPIVQGNFVIFTANSDLRRVGIAFAHDDFRNVYWFRQLAVSQDPLNAPIPPGQKAPDPYKDSGIQFYVHEVPPHIRELEYRIVINGLWTVDPSNEITRRDPVSGLSLSVLYLPPRQTRPNPLSTMPEGLTFIYRAAPGEIITIGGNFNSWDPFMYEMREGPAGVYTIMIPLPPGNYQYVFFHRGQRYVDPNNPNRIYARDGSAASVIDVPN